MILSHVSGSDDVKKVSSFASSRNEYGLSPHLNINTLSLDIVSMPKVTQRAVVANDRRIRLLPVHYRCYRTIALSDASLSDAIGRLQIA